VGHSSDDNEEINQIFRDAGADHILPKPSKLTLVKELLESIFWNNHKWKINIIFYIIYYYNIL
jgi:hypothetical protein